MALVEVLVAARALGRNTQPGDILDVRVPRGELGTKEVMDVICFVVDESAVPARGSLRGETVKHRYNVDLDALGVDRQRAEDPNDAYQPFVTRNARGRISVSRVPSVPQPTDREQP